MAGALRGMGKLERSIFILNYMPDAVMQRRSLTALNKGEAIQGLARAIHIGQSGELREPGIILIKDRKRENRSRPRVIKTRIVDRSSSYYPKERS